MNQSASRPDTMLKRRAVALVCFFSLVIPSCIPPLRHPQPGPGLPETYELLKTDPKSDLPDVFNTASQTENSAQIRVEEFFSDPLLTGLISQAIGGNQELRILNENVQVASNEILSRQGAYIPFIYPVAGAGVDKFSNYTLPGAGIRSDMFAPGLFLPNPLPNYMLGAAFFWTPDVWRQLHNAKDAAVNRYYATAEARNYFVTDLIARIADSYYELMALDKRIEILDQTIALQERSLEVAKSIKEGARGTELPVQRFLAEVRRNQSEKLIVNQQIIEAENRINFLLGRNPQHVDRMNVDFINLTIHPLGVGIPSEILRNRPDVRQAERELAAAGLDVLVARKRFYPQGSIMSGVGFQAFDPRYLFISPEALIANAAGNVMMPFINRKAIKADYLTADARQLQAVYNYQRIVLTAFTEVVNRLSKVENYRNSIEVKKQQLAALEEAVNIAMNLFRFARADYVDVLFAQRDLRDARTVTVETKQEQLAAVVDTYQALGGGSYLLPIPVPKPLQPKNHGWKFWKHSGATPPPDTIPGPVMIPGPPAENGPPLVPTPNSNNEPKLIPPPANVNPADSVPGADSNKDGTSSPKPGMAGGNPEPLPPLPANRTPEQTRGLLKGDSTAPDAGLGNQLLDGPRDRLEPGSSLLKPD